MSGHYHTSHGEAENSLTIKMLATDLARHPALSHHATRSDIATSSQVRGDQDDRCAGLGKVEHHLVDLGLGPDVDSLRRLVEDEYPA